MNSFVKNIDFIEKHFVEIKASNDVALDLKYATTENFMKKNIYEGFNRCFVTPLMFSMFNKACAVLRATRPDLQFLIWDTLRPRSIQAEFYDQLKNTPFQDYVAAPNPGSLHNFGMAIDLTLQTKDGSLLDMGTEFDDFNDLSQPKLEEKFLASGKLTNLQLENRLLLRNLLEKQGFQVLPHEWWHFNALPKEKVYGKFPILE